MASTGFPILVCTYFCILVFLFSSRVHASDKWLKMKGGRSFGCCRLIACFISTFNCVIHHQCPGLGGRVSQLHRCCFSRLRQFLLKHSCPMDCKSLFLIFSFVLHPAEQKIFSARRKLPSNHVTLFTAPPEKLSKTVGRMHGSQGG